MQIITGISGFLSMRSHKDTHMFLIRSLVGTEPCITIYAIRTVSNRKTAHRIVECRYSVDKFGGKSLEYGIGAAVQRLVGVEPFTVLMTGEQPEEIYDLMHITTQRADTATSSH